MNDDAPLLNKLLDIRNDLMGLCEDNEVMKETISDYFLELISND